MSHILRNSCIVIFILLISCKTSKFVSSYKTKNTSVTHKTIVSEKYNITDTKLRNELLNNELNFNKLYSKKLNISLFDGKKKRSFKGSYVIKKDTAIIFSIMVMNIEFIRAQFKPDSITIIDKHDKKVFKTDYSFFSRKYNIDINFNILQGLLSNSPFIFPPSKQNIVMGLKKYKHGVSDNLYTLSTIKNKRLNRLNKRNNRGALLHNMYIYTDLFRIKKHFIKDFSNNQTLEINYSGFKKFSDILFPHFIEFNASKANKVFHLHMQTNYLEINKGGSLHFKIPSSYEVDHL